MITLKNISKIHDDKEIFRNVNFTINTNDKVAIIGNNGVGKTTLMKIIFNQDYSTTGEVIRNSGTIGYLSQEVFNSIENRLEDELEKLDIDLYNLQLKIKRLKDQYEATNDEKILNLYIESENRFVDLGGYERKHQIMKMVTAFGFTSADLKKKIAEFSGGQRTILSLIKLLLLAPDYLLLDEPTNHLDVEKITWLENFLKSYKKTVIVISHDRYFVDNVCTKIVELENKQASVYNTNYTNYLLEKELRYEYQLAAYETQQKFIKKCEDFITKNRGTPSKIGQVNDRKSKLEKLELIEMPVKINQKITFKFNELNLKKSTYVDVINADIGYTTPLITNVNFRLFGGDKLGIIGNNGVGKSTLLKTLLKEITPLSNQVIVHPSIKIAYFSQDVNKFDGFKTVYEFAESLMPGESTTQIRKILGQFLFKREDVFKKITALSGGELVRLTLLEFNLNQYDLLIFDEPTNHLDINAKTVLEDALKNYNGSIICVSHDRYFINQVVNKFIYIGNQQIHEYTGQFNDYQQFLVEQPTLVNNDVGGNAQTKVKSVKKKEKVNLTLRKYEREIIKLETEIEELNAEVLLPEIYNDWQKAKQVNEKIAELQMSLDEVYELYEKELDETE